MALPHIVQMQLIKKRIKGKEGKAKLNEIELIREELPGFNTGHYGKIKQWLTDEVKKTKTVANVKHQDWLGVKKQGVKQFVLVGCPSVGKSSLINKLSGMQTKIASYEFTTLKPLPAIVNINSAEIQIVDLPGLLPGAVDDIGGGKRLIGIVKQADGIILMHDLSKDISEVLKIQDELVKARINQKLLVVGNKVDTFNAEKNLLKLKEYFPDNKVLGISVINNFGLNKLKSEIWKTSNLIRVYPKNTELPLVLEKCATVKDFVEKVHTSLVKKFKFARVTGKSSKFANQQVGFNHTLEDEDVIELVLER
jgi:uncharacterized protein